MNRTVRSTLILASALIALPASAQTQQEHDWCYTPSSDDETIAGCTAVIQSGHEGSEQLGIAYLGRGSAYKHKGLYDLAIADYTQYIAHKPEPLGYVYRGDSYEHKGLYDQAIADYTRAIALDPDWGEARNDRAWAYHKKGEDARGLPDAEAAVELRPDHATNLETRAEIYEKLGQRDKAVADYRAALKIRSSYQPAKDGLKRLGVTP